MNPLRYSRRISTWNVIVWIIVIVLFFLGLFVRCSVIKEDRLYITRAYVGQFINAVKQDKGYEIQTTKDVFHILCDSVLNIPENTRVWIKLEERTRIVEGRYYKPFLTFGNDSTLFELKFNQFTSELQ